MLVLTRKLGQSIKIGDDIEIKIVGVDGDQIKLGIEAPREVEIHRKEVYEAILEENGKAAAQIVSPDILQSLKSIKNIK
ncbi:carbon storage regulator CsrA [Terrilactibacillus laevilacticus]|uniref:carbon storage regulator CsrA n=1 Tax=Terrilactibacillus laevilacticus TaxID=1380157 RepID=UPI0011472248|nr:carbon storage regulator CsrA [Terrilactibacillus laevilacticus]